MDSNTLFAEEMLCPAVVGGGKKPERLRNVHDTSVIRRTHGNLDLTGEPIWVWLLCLLSKPAAWR